LSLLHQLLVFFFQFSYSYSSSSPSSSYMYYLSAQKLILAYHPTKRRRLVTYSDDLPAFKQSPIRVVAGPIR